MSIELEALEEEFSILKLASPASVDLSVSPLFAAVTEDEVSLVCPSAGAPADSVKRSDGWKALRVRGVLDFSLVGILSGITAALAEAGVSVFAVSTFDTDYILVRTQDLGRAADALEEKGWRVTTEPKPETPAASQG